MVPCPWGVRLAPASLPALDMKRPPVSQLAANRCSISDEVDKAKFVDRSRFKDHEVSSEILDGLRDTSDQCVCLDKFLVSTQTTNLCDWVRNVEAGPSRIEQLMQSRDRMLCCKNEMSGSEHGSEPTRQH